MPRGKNTKVVVIRAAQFEDGGYPAGELIGVTTVGGDVVLVFAVPVD